MVEPRFVHLRAHSDYSMIDGLAKIESLVKKAADLKMPALAITDFTNLCGLIKFYKIAYSAGIKPLIGADFFVQNDRTLLDELTQITVLAMNNTGYKNLTLLISHAYQRGYCSSGPWIDREWLIKFNEGILLISGGRKGDLGKSLLSGNLSKVEQHIAFYKQYFPDRFYLELVRTGRSDEERYLCAAVDLSEKFGIPVVATNDVRFINKDDFNAHEIRVAIHDGFILDDPKRPKEYSSEQYMRSEEEMCNLFLDVPAALKNSVEIAKRCNVVISFGKHFLPEFPTGNMSTEEFLIMKSKKGLDERLLFLFPNEKEREEHRTKYNKRLNKELKIINKMGFPGYFLIVMEFIQWSKDNGIPVGPGRGSGAGSLVAYALKITDIDPLKFDLIFERFLNPERISMPDFDIDFCMEKRDQVIEHVSDMYGRDSVSQIITFGTMTAKAVIRDVGRVLGHPYGFIDRISKLVPSNPGITLTKAFENEPKLIEIYKTDKEVQFLIQMSLKLEGVTRNAGKHAGGVVIAPTKITDFTPLYCDEKGQNPVTQFDKNDVEFIGLVKFDFLGLRTLTVINRTIEMVNKHRNQKKESLLSTTSIPMEDKKSFEMLKRSETTAVFQLESPGMRDLIKRLQPDCFEDIIALVALFRPGPLQSGMVDNFINRKHGLEEISYPDGKWQHESLKPILASTYGIILYQEQVMQIAQVLSGYTLGSADMLRRAIGKKKPSEMAKQRSLFEEGAKKHGVNSLLSMKIFDLVEKFAGYGFNKSHSAAYALVSYHTLWLKTHYPAEFMSSVMTSDIDNLEKIVLMIEECRRIGIRVLPPDINSSLYDFYVNKHGEIVYGMGAIKGIGLGPIEAIIKARNDSGDFHDIFDFCTRIDIKKINRRILEKLIMSGSLDRLGSNRSMLMHSLDDALKSAHQKAKDKAVGQKDMFDALVKDPKQIQKSHTICKPWSEKTALDNERETLGLYLTMHPIDKYLKEIKHYSKGYRLKDVHLTKRGETITVAGLVVSEKITLTSQGKRIGIYTLDDRSGRLDVILFKDILEKYRILLKKDRILIFVGKINFDNFTGRFRMIASEVMDIKKAREKYLKGLSIVLTDHQIDDSILNEIYRFLESHCLGTVPVYLYRQRLDVRFRLQFDKKWRISPSDQFLNGLYNLVGSEQVKLEF